MEHIILYPRGIKGANKLPVQDLRQIAKFNHIVINYLIMDRLLKEMKKEIKYVGASFCCQCKTFRPKVEAFCKEKEIKFTYVDAEEESEFVAGLGIRNIPTVLLYEGEELVKRGGIANWAADDSAVKDVAFYIDKYNQIKNTLNR